MPLSEEQKLMLEVESAWEGFMNSDVDRHARMLRVLDPKFYSLMKLAYQHGYSDGAQSVYRSLKQ